MLSRTQTLRVANTPLHSQIKPGSRVYFRDEEPSQGFPAGYYGFEVVTCIAPRNTKK